MSHAYSNFRRAILALTLLLTVSISQGLAQWVEAPSLPQVRNLAMHTYADGKLYVFGGAPNFKIDLQGAVIPVEPSYNTAMVYNTAGTSWTALANMPQPRNGGFAFAANGKIYIGAGGYFSNNVLTFTANVLEYDPVTNTYAEKAAMPTPVTGAAYAAIGTKIYVFGGLARGTQGLTFSAAVQVYDVTTNSWEVPAGTAPYASFYSTATAIGQKILMVGGVTSNGSSLVHSRNAYLGSLGVSGITWTKVADYPVGVSLAASGTLGGKGHIVAGITSGGATNVAFRYEEPNNTWAISYGLPIGSANVHTMPSDGTALYFISGQENIKTYKLTSGTPAAVAYVPQTTLLNTARVGDAATDLTLRVANIGIVPLEGSLIIPVDAQSWISTSNGTFTNILPNTYNDMTLRIGSASLAAGDYKATVIVRSNDPNRGDIPVTVRLFVRENIETQPTKVVMEESSGNWCPPCGSVGIPLIRQLTQQHGDNLIFIAYHDRGGRPSEPMHTAETEDISQRLGVPFWPAASFQRWIFAGQSAQMMGTDVWASAINAVRTNQPNAPMAMELKEYKYDLLSNKVTGKLELRATEAMGWNSNISLRVTAVVTEDSIQYPQAGLSEDPFYHMHVARSFWPDVLGREVTIPASALTEDGAVIMPGAPITVDFDFTPSNVRSANRSHVVFLVHINQGTALGPILQGMEHKMTASIGGTSGFTLEAGTTSKAITPGQEVVFEPVVRNSGTTPLQITATRISADYPEDNWSSRICVGDDCAEATANSKTTSLAPGGSKTFKLRVMTGSAGQGKVTLRFTDGNDNEFEQEFIITASGSGVSLEAVAGNGLRLMQNSPNPASSVTRFGYTLPSASNVTVDVFSVNGEKVLAISKGLVESGDNSLDLDVSSLASGIYTVRLTANGTSVSRTISVAR